MANNWPIIYQKSTKSKANDIHESEPKKIRLDDVGNGMKGEKKAVEVEYISNTVPIDKLKALIERETVQVYWKGGSSSTWVKVHEVDSDEGVVLKETYEDKKHRKPKVLDTGSSIECDEEIVNGEKETT